MLNPTVLTAGQEREQRGGFVLGSSWNGKGTHMWRLKQEKPELFDRHDQLKLLVAAKKSEAKIPGYESCNMDGWLFNKEKGVYLERATGQRFWWDEVSEQYRPLREGEARPVAFSGGAAALPGKGDGRGGDADKGSKQAPRHVLISDLHGAAKALKMDFDHLDRPAGALALIGASADGSPPSEAVARALPEKLLRRLAAFRGEWSDDMLAGALASTFAEITAALGGVSPAAAVALVAGQRIVVAASPGARFVVATQPISEATEPPPRVEATPSAGEPTATRCRKLLDSATETLLVALVVGDRGPGAALNEVTLTSPHLLRCRPRAASAALLQSYRQAGATGPLAAACARLGTRPDGQLFPVEAASSSGGPPPAKRLRADETATKIRLRQILLRHASATRPVDPVRGKPVKRSLEEAEKQMLGILDSLTADGCASFASVCKSLSECQSALKGGEFAGDLGWQDRRSADAQKQSGSERSMRVQVPNSVLKAAFELGIGELGDLLTSEVGVHIIQRTA